MTDSDIQAIKQVIEESYIRGVHEIQDRILIDGGFHQSFEMLVLAQKDVEKVDVPAWLERIETMKEENPDLWGSQTTYKFKLVDATGSAAVAKLDVFKGGYYFSTDYMLLYKINGEWTIVSKVFTVES
jgi:hypothetical protein